MRIIGRLLLFLLLLPPLTWGGIIAFREIQLSLGGDPMLDLHLTGAERAVIYPLDDKAWTRFPLAGAQEAVRVLTHADVAAEDDYPPEQSWRYAIAFEFIGPGGELLHGIVQNYLVHPRPSRAASGWALNEEWFYPGETDSPTSAIPTVFNLESLGPVREIRARVAAADPEVQQVNLRVYERQPVSERRLAATWHRLAGAQRDRLVEGSVYPPAMMTEEEWRSALRRRWNPVGPRGVEGSDYRSRVLYRRPVPDLPREEETYEEAESNGVSADPASDEVLAFELAPGRELAYPVAINNRGPARSFRLDLTCPCDAAVSVAFSNEEGQENPIETVTLEAQPDEPPPLVQSDPDTWRRRTVFFAVPSGTTAILIGSEAPVLVSGFTRPTDLPVGVRALGNAVQESPTWFEVRPEHWRTLPARARDSLGPEEWRPRPAREWLWEPIPVAGVRLTDQQVETGGISLDRQHPSTRFTFNKLRLGREALAVDVATLPGSGETVTLQVDLSLADNRLGVHADWTIPSYRIELGGAYEDSRIVIPLGRDLPLGGYDVRVELLHGHGARLSFQRGAPAPENDVME